MAKTAKQELVAQIEWFQSIVSEYKNAQANPPEGIDTQALAGAIEQIEAKISELQIRLEVMVAVALFYPDNNLRTSPLPVRQLCGVAHA